LLLGFCPVGFKMAFVEEKPPSSASSCCLHGPGYATPLDAMSGPREEIIYVTAVYTGETLEPNLNSALFVQENNTCAFA
jgi:hypothetical protein